MHSEISDVAMRCDYEDAQADLCLLKGHTSCSCLFQAVVHLRAEYNAHLTDEGIKAKNRPLNIFHFHVTKIANQASRF